MRKCLTFNNHKTLKYQLKCMRLEMKEREKLIKNDAENYVSNLPKKILLPNKHKTKTIIPNPFGKLLAKGVNKTILNKEGFLTKLISGILLKRVGKKIERRFIRQN